MAPHSSTLAWKVSWMEEPGRLQSMGSLRVGHDWATSLSLFTFMHWRRKWQPTPVFLPGESHGRRSLVGIQSMGSPKSQTRLIDWAGIFVLTREYDCILQKQQVTAYGRNKGVKSWRFREEPSGRFRWKELWDLNVLLQGQQTPWCLLVSISWLRTANLPSIA